MPNYAELYETLIKENYPTRQALQKETIKLDSILSLPKGTEHFMSDLHGEYQAFKHLVNNCSGVIREKISLCLSDLSKEEQDEFATLIYYPNEKLKLISNKNEDWYFKTIYNLIQLASLISSKYSRQYVKKFIAPDYAYVIDELLHTKDNSESNIREYFNNIIKSIIKTDASEEYIKELCKIIKSLAVSRLHIVGDIFDRGSHPGSIIELLKKHHSLDIQYGNHDVLWFGAHSGNQALIFYVIYNCVKYNNFSVLENSYGISLRKLINYSKLLYDNSENVINPLIKTTLILLMKLEGKIIKNYPQLFNNVSLVLNNIDYNKGTYHFNGKDYILKDTNLKGINYNDPYSISSVEEDIINSLTKDFKNSPRLKDHLNFLISKGSVYKNYNNNLLYHGCVPLDQSGDYKTVYTPSGYKKGKELFDYLDKLIKKVVNNDLTDQELDYFYYLWNGFDSPFTGRWYKTFESNFLSDEELQIEKRNPYYTFRNNKDVCERILRDFGLNDSSHIINGHLPVKVKDGESPIKADGKLLIIDGGFCQAYHNKTGIAGYTLINNSHGLRIKAHEEFCGLDEVLKNNKDIISETKIIETYQNRLTIKDTTEGHNLKIILEGLKLELEKNKA